MSGWVIVAIVAIVMGSLTSIYKARRDERMGVVRDHRDKPIEVVREERDEARAELADLRERVKVLERIATDPARRTAEEIEKLRDE